MEQVMDKVVWELQQLVAATSANGGISDIADVQAIYWGDPGRIPINLYPCFTTQPLKTHRAGETTGYRSVDDGVLITFLIDAREYFDKDVDEASGDRVVVKVMEACEAWMERTAKRKLDGLAGVRDAKVLDTDYLPQKRGDVIAKSAQLTLAVQMQYQRQK